MTGGMMIEAIAMEGLMINVIKKIISTIIKQKMPLACERHFFVLPDSDFWFDFLNIL